MTIDRKCDMSDAAPMGPIHTDDLLEFAHSRQAAEGHKYVMPDGSNQAWLRDTVQDIAEELSDAYVLAELLDAQFAEQFASAHDILLVRQVQRHIGRAWDFLVRVGECNAAKRQRDQVDVERPVLLKASARSAGQYKKAVDQAEDV